MQTHSLILHAAGKCIQKNILAEETVCTKKTKTREKSLLFVRETKFGFGYLFKSLEFEPIWSGSKKHTCSNSVSLQPLFLLDTQRFNAFFKLPILPFSKLRNLEPNHVSATVPLYSAKSPWNYRCFVSPQLLDEWQKLSTAHMIRLHKLRVRAIKTSSEREPATSYI